MKIESAKGREEENVSLEIVIAEGQLMIISPHSGLFD